MPSPAVTAASTTAAELRQEDPRLGGLRPGPVAQDLWDHVALIGVDLGVVDHPVVVGVQHREEGGRVGAEFGALEEAVVIGVRLGELGRHRIGLAGSSPIGLAAGADEQAAATTSALCVTRGVAILGRVLGGRGPGERATEDNQPAACHPKTLGGRYCSSISFRDRAGLRRMLA
jgi:hypothetical protein